MDVEARKGECCLFSFCIKLCEPSMKTKQNAESGYWWWMSCDMRIGFADLQIYDLTFFNCTNGMLITLHVHIATV